MFSQNTEYNIIKEEHHWTSEEKLKYCGYGEWVEESDVTVFEYLGYEACVCRIFVRESFSREESYFGGHLCGYVKIPEDHPLFREKNFGLECHGGITFNEPHEEHWIGFHCAHLGDLVPTLKGYMPHESLKFYMLNSSYRNTTYCVDECTSIITQLIDIADKSKTVGLR